VVGGKLWQIWWIECHSPIFYPTKFISIFINSRLPDKKFVCTWVKTWGTNSGAKISILKYLHSLAEAEAKFDPSDQLFVITLNYTFYWKCIHRYWSRDLSNYQSWVIASLNTNYFTKDDSPLDLPKFFSYQYYRCWAFAKDFLAKTLKLLIRQSFSPPEFCAIQYFVLVILIIIESSLCCWYW